jgi:DNA-binding NtrC family response regulator
MGAVDVFMTPPGSSLAQFSPIPATGHAGDRGRFDFPNVEARSGNIRELQNSVERSVILCSGDTFSIDEAWLSIQDSAKPAPPAKMTSILQGQEKEIIESALAESRGKVAGADGAAAKLGIPPSTFDSKIKQLRIKKENRTAF